MASGQPFPHDPWRSVSLRYGESAGKPIKRWPSKGHFQP